MDAVTISVVSYIKTKHINLSELSRTTGINYKQLYASLGDKSRNRELRAWELLKICNTLDVDPRRFSIDVSEGK